MRPRQNSRYRFNESGTDLVADATHTAELPFVFNHLDELARRRNATVTAGAAAVAAAMGAAWAGLARGDAPADWPAFGDGRALRVFQSAGPALQPAADWRAAACAFWAETCPSPFDDSCSLAVNATPVVADLP